MLNKVLIIDDEEKLRTLLSKIITLDGFEVLQAGDAKSGLKKLETADVDVVICDVKLPDYSGVELSKTIKEKYPAIEIILLTAYGNIPDSVQAIKNGAFDYITKGDDNNKIIPLLYKATEKVVLAKRVLQLEKQLGNKHSFDNIIGKSKIIKAAIDAARKVASTEATVLLIISAGCGMAIAAVVFFSMKERATDKLGNFYFLFVRSCTRILFPIALIIAVLLVFNSTPMTFEGKDSITNLQGDTVQVSRGPVAAFVAIKQIGTNGGGFVGPNSAHPFENPSYFTNIIETISIFLIPIAMIFALGYVLKRKKLAWTIFGVMTIGFLLLVIPTVINEMNGNPAIAKMGIAQPMGSMEGKEVRFGSAASAYWAINTTVTSNGSVNAMHDSLTPLSGMLAMLGMMVNAFYGGVGVGFLNFYIFIILAVFISGLMVGRTPEFLGKKIEAREMKIAMIIALLHPFLILVSTSIASHLYAHNPTEYADWLNNPGHHGFSEMLYEFTSSNANNGSGFEGLGDNTPFWNIACGIVMLLARYLPIIGPVAIAGILANKNYIPESAGTPKTDTASFGLMVLAVIAIIAALSFFPALALGPIAEYFSIY